MSWANGDLLTPAKLNTQALSGTLSVGDGTHTVTDPAIIAARQITTGTDNARGFLDCTNFARTTGSAAYASFDNIPTFTGTTNYDHHSGFQARADIGMTGTMTNLYSFWAQPNISAAGATVTNVYGAYLRNPIGDGSVTNNYGLVVEGMSKGGTLNYAIYTNAGVVRFGDIVHINDTANAKMTIGLTINQGDNDNEILAFKSSDVGHGMTDVMEADTFGAFSKIHATNGGLAIYGVQDNGAVTGTGIRMHGLITDGAQSGTRDTNTTAPIYLNVAMKDGTGVTTLGGDRNLVAVGDNLTTRFFLDSDGDSHQDVGTAWTNFDIVDDVATLNLLSAHLTRPDDPLRAGFSDWLEQDKEILERLDLVQFNADGHHFVNMSRLTMLHTGAIRQLGSWLAQMESKLASLAATHPALLPNA